jgi:hypothetical protein
MAGVSVGACRLLVVRREVRVAQPGQRDRDEAVGRCCGGQGGTCDVTCVGLLGPLARTLAIIKNRPGSEGAVAERS